MVTRSLVWLLMEEHELWPVIAMLYLERHDEVSRERLHSTTHPLWVHAEGSTCPFTLLPQSWETTLRSKRWDNGGLKEAAEYRSIKMYLVVLLRSDVTTLSWLLAQERGRKAAALLPERSDVDNIVTARLWRNDDETWFVQELTVESFCEASWAPAGFYM